MRKGLLRDTLETVRAAGFEPEVEQRRHVHIVWIDGNGRKRRVVLSRSPSDINASRMNRAALRRMLVPHSGTCANAGAVPTRTLRKTGVRP